MLIVIAKPPEWIWNACNEKFNISKGTVWTVGDTLFNPDNSVIPDHLLAHEEVHSKQQSCMGVDEWWREYLDNAKFRLEQEVWAYKAQYKFICNTMKDKNYRFKNLHILATHLSSPLYGSLVSPEVARRLIMAK
jgi:hypothetical protein